IPLPIVYLDDDVLVVDKPAGLVVHPAPGHASGTLVNAVLGLWTGCQVSGVRCQGTGPDGERGRGGDGEQDGAVPASPAPPLPAACPCRDRAWAGPGDVGVNGGGAQPGGRGEPAAAAGGADGPQAVPGGGARPPRERAGVDRGADRAGPARPQAHGGGRL